MKLGKFPNHNTHSPSVITDTTPYRSNKHGEDMQSSVI